MYLWDSFFHYQEGGLLRKLDQHCTANFPKCLSEIEIKMPLSKFAQIQRSIEFRNMVSEFNVYFENNFRFKLSGETGMEITQQKLEFLETSPDLMSKFMTLSKPLPFFIDFPYTETQNNDFSEKSCSKLLNILLKVLLYLPLAEVLELKLNNSDIDDCQSRSPYPQ